MFSSHTFCRSAFQFTTSQGGRPKEFRRVSGQKAFNSRPHKEVDLLLSGNTFHSSLSIHDLTRRSTLDTFSTYRLSDFQFTTSQGGRPGKPRVRYRNTGLSIHDLTRRSTIEENFKSFWNYLSIHDLTRRSTCVITDRSVVCSSFNSRPHKEVDDIASSYPFQIMTFQFTTSQGGRQEMIVNSSRELDLSIHDLTRRSTLLPASAWIVVSFFQFTTSQGGRPSVNDGVMEVTILSIHDLTRRSTHLSSRKNPSPCPFNSRPHKEVDNKGGE